MPKKKMNYEQALSRLEEIAALLEGQDVGLEESVKLLEEGNKLALECESMLKAAKLIIEKDMESNGDEGENHESV